MRATGQRQRNVLFTCTIYNQEQVCSNKSTTQHPQSETGKRSRARTHLTHTHIHRAEDSGMNPPLAVPLQYGRQPGGLPYPAPTNNRQQCQHPTKTSGVPLKRGESRESSRAARPVRGQHLTKRTTSFRDLDPPPGPTQRFARNISPHLSWFGWFRNERSTIGRPEVAFYHSFSASLLLICFLPRSAARPTQLLFSRKARQIDITASSSVSFHLHKSAIMSQDKEFSYSDVSEHSSKKVRFDDPSSPLAAAQVTDICA